MKRSDIEDIPAYYRRYIDAVDDMEILDALQYYDARIFRREYEALARIGDRVYAEGKWTVRDILQHVVDTERVMAYRALRVARNDQTPLPGFDQDKYAAAAKVSARTLDDLMDELEAARHSTILMFRNFNDEALRRQGVCSGQNISALALGFVIAGHPVHHLDVIKEKYLV